MRDMEDLLIFDEKGSILIVDDDPTNLEILSEALEDTYDIMCATNGEDALEAAREDLPDLILLDVMMPEMDGYQVCAALKADPLTAKIPVIFLTGLSSNSDEAKGLELGAADYISKPINVPIVRLRMNNHMKLTKALAKLKKLSTTDGLTELANRRQMDKILKSECSSSRTTTTELSVILLDIDHFKAYNDTYGHQEGDDCLKQVSQLLSQTVSRKMDLVARYGGEEFCCILPATPHENAMVLAERIRSNVEGLQLPNQGSLVNDYVTISLGVVTTIPGTPTMSEKILSIADKNLYKAKESGRNKVVGTDCK
jgi:diguanylate cyclase (GGDEF)-like protein